MYGLLTHGGIVMYLLVGCSIIAFTIIVERLWFWWRERQRANMDQLHTFFDHIHEGNLDRARELADRKNNPLLESMTKALGHSNVARTHALHEALELEIEKAINRTQRYLAGLDTIATLSPLLGIFGTVLGIIQSFQVIGMTSVPDPQAMGSGLAEALLTTAAGLAVAMPSLMFHNLFLSMSERHISRLDKFHREFEIHSEDISRQGSDSS